MKPNLLYIFADQWRAQAVSYRKEDQVLTPNIDRFASESMRFSNAFSTFPLCSPHRASLMTGKYPFSVGMWTNCKIGLEEKIMLKPQETCIGNVLKSNGYQTGYIGKWHLDASELNFTKHPASKAKEWDAYTPPGERRQGFDYWLSYGADDNHLDPHYWMDHEEQIRPGKWSVEFETDKAIEYMDVHKDTKDPFALFVSYNPPHLPYELVPDKYYEKFKDMPVNFRENVPEEYRTKELETITRQYFSAIYGVDEQFGRIYEYLKQNHLEENTIVVLSADHGEMLGSHKLMSKNIWYDESIHIPLMVRQSGRIKPEDNSVIFASPDHMPTLLGLLDCSVPNTCQGYNHADGILSSKEDTEAPQDMFLCSYPGADSMVKAFSSRGLTHKAYGWRGIRTHRYTYVVVNGYEPDLERIQYLYDNQEDKYQMHPTIIPSDSKDPMILEFRDRLKEYLKLTDDPFIGI